MYTIILKDDKSLVKSVVTTLVQGEVNCDTIQFLIPPKYENKDLSGCNVILQFNSEYVNTIGAELLVKDADLYKGYLRYTVGVNTNINKYCGDLNIKLYFTEVENDDSTSFLLITKESTIKIERGDYNFIYINPANASINDSTKIVDEIIFEGGAAPGISESNGQLTEETEIVEPNDNDTNEV